MLEERLCSVTDIEPGQALRFAFGKTPVCLVRIDDDFYAIGDTCSHAKISLSEGEIHAESLEIECWKHGSCFSLVDGQPHALPATKATPVFTVKIEGDDVFVEVV